MTSPDTDKVPTLLWTSREAAKALAVSERTLWSLTQRGDIRCVRIGRAVRYDPTDLRAWIEACKAEAARKCHIGQDT